MVTPEDDDIHSLQRRVRTMMEGIDLERDMTEPIESSIAFGELGGSVASDVCKKLMILKGRGQISSDELAQFIVASLSKETQS